MKLLRLYLAPDIFTIKHRGKENLVEAAYITCESGEQQIIVARTLSLPRKTFLVAHELLHYVTSNLMRNPATRETINDQIDKLRL